MEGRGRVGGVGVWKKYERRGGEKAVKEEKTKSNENKFGENFKNQTA